MPSIYYNHHPILSVVVCTFNRAQLLRTCLCSLIEQSLEPSKFEILIINNNSTDETETVAKEFVQNTHNTRLILEKMQGLSHARNTGIRESLGKFVAFIDDDAKATKTWCQNIIDAFSNTIPAPDVVGGVIEPWFPPNKPNWFTDDLERCTWGERAEFLNGDLARDGFSGSNVAFRRELLFEFHGFSVNLGMVGNTVRVAEETDLFRRMYRRHIKLWYDPSIIVFHYVPSWKLTLIYRFRRGWMRGQAERHMMGPLTVKSWLIELSLLAKNFVSLPKKLLYSPQKKTQIARSIHLIGYQFGFLFCLNRLID
jgi:glucosyl-dolichyl phosphate glucuronosyltransferase